MRTTFWDVLSVLTVLGIIGIIGIFGLIYLNPYVPFNPFPPPFRPMDSAHLLQTLAPSGTLFLIESTSTYTSTSRLGPTWTPDIREIATNTIRPSATSTPTVTYTPSISPTITQTPTITGTPPTSTPSKTLTPSITFTRTATKTINAAAATSAARTAFAAQTNEARIQKTESAIRTKTAQSLSFTQTALSIKKTQDAYSQKQTENALKLTLTAQAIQKTENITNQQRTETAVALAKTEAVANQRLTETAQAVKTATQLAYDQRQTEIALQKTQTAAPNQTFAAVQTLQQQTNIVKTANAKATETAVQATANATATMVARATQIVILPIVYGVDTDLAGPPYDYEQINTTRIIGGAGWPISLDLTSVGFDDVDSIGSWWLDDTLNLWYVLFSESGQSPPLYRILYTDKTIYSVLPSPVGANASPFVNIQSGADYSRWVVFTRSESGVRDLWRMRGDGSVAQALTNSPSLSTWDDHDASWTPDGNIIYVTGEKSKAMNIYVLTPGNTPPGTPLTTYGGIVEIDSPKWCRGWDWTAGAYKDRVVFARRAGPTDDWDLFSADPTDWDNTLVQLTDTDGIDELNPSWSPYCDRIVYVSNGGGQYDVWHMAWDASDFDPSYADVTNRLTDDANVEHNPIWRPSD